MKKKYSMPYIDIEFLHDGQDIMFGTSTEQPDFFDGGIIAPWEDDND